MDKNTVVSMTGECVMCYSTKQDDLFVVYVTNEYASLLESVFKTEFVTMLAKHYKQEVGKPLPMRFNDRSVSAVARPFRATMCTPQLLEFIHNKGKFLYSAVSSPQDHSKRFTLYFPDRPVHSDTISASLGSIQPYDTINA